MARLDFSHRAELEELMDGPCSYEELRDCLRDISRVNRLTWAYRPTMQWLDRVVDSHAHSSSGLRGAGPLRIIDVGCGYGDMLRRIEGWAASRQLEVALTGIDLNPDAVRAAREATPASSRIQWIAGDLYTCAAAAEADIVISSLVMHHLTEKEIVRFVAWMDRTARVGWFINDLHRQATPYRIFSLLMRGPWWHRFVRADGLASIRKSFVPEDWRRICSAAGVAAEISEFRPARLCVGRIGGSI